MPVTLVGYEIMDTGILIYRTSDCVTILLWEE
jgi:hypothetical protein